MNIESIKWIDQNAKEAIVTVGSSYDKILCYSYPCDYQIGDKIVEQLECLDTKAVIVCDRSYKITKLESAFGYELQGRIIDIENGIVDVDGLIGTEGRSHGELDGGIFLDLLVPVQVIDGVIGGADKGHVALLDQAADGQLGVVLQLVVAQVPHFLSGVAVQHAVVAEENVQLQIGPVVHGVANGHGQSLGKLLEALAVGLVAGDVLLGHAVGTHHAPLIMIAEVAAVRVAAAQPHLRDVLKAAVLVDLAGRDVAVIVADGHSSCIVVIQMLCGSRLEHEVLIHKCFHGILTPFL